MASSLPMGWMSTGRMTRSVTQGVGGDNRDRELLLHRGRDEPVAGGVRG